MTVDLIEEWVKNVWVRHPGVLLNPLSVLVVDGFHGHSSEDQKDKLEKKNCDFVVIPGGMTSQLQPLEASIHKPFNGYLRKEYEAWLLSENFPLIPFGKIKRASASKLAEWSWLLGGRSQEKQWNSHLRNDKCA